MLQAMNTGHDGSMTTAHSNGPRHTRSRMETMTLMAGMELPVPTAIHHLPSMSWCIKNVCAMARGKSSILLRLWMEGDVITMTDIFAFEQSGYENGKVIGRLRPTGLRPKFMEKIEASGIHLPATIFGIGDRRRY